jgi:ketopantoate reductase
MSGNLRWPQVAVIGAGAAGGYFGRMRARLGEQVAWQPH